MTDAIAVLGAYGWHLLTLPRGLTQEPLQDPRLRRITAPSHEAARVPKVRAQPEEQPVDRAPRAVVGALIGAEVGAAAGLLFVGDVPLAPLGCAAAGALTGPVAARGIAHLRTALVGRWLRAQVRQAHPPRAQAAKR
jgi:hypothetical protein